MNYIINYTTRTIHSNTLKKSIANACSTVSRPKNIFAPKSKQVKIKSVVSNKTNSNKQVKPMN